MKDVSDVYLTPEQVAAKLDLNIETIYRWLRTRKIRASRISQKAWRIPERELASFDVGTFPSCFSRSKPRSTNSDDWNTNRSFPVLPAASTTGSHTLSTRSGSK